MSAPYAELHAISNFTFLRGASHPAELVRQAHALGYSALAITDECSLAGVVRAHVAARDCGLPLIIGTEVTLVEGARLVLLAADREGYGHLAALVTLARRRAGKGEYRLGCADLDGGPPGCLALLLPPRPAAGTIEGAIAVDPLPAALMHARWLADCFPGRAWIAVERCMDGAGDLPFARALARGCGLPLVATGDVHMHVRARRPLQDVLTAIRLGVPLAQAGDRLHGNGERHLRSRARLARLYPPALLAEAVRVAGRCRFCLEELRYEYPRELVPEGQTPSQWLRALTFEGGVRRWPGGMPEKVHAQIEHELALIAELGYEAFFLTVHDIVRFARSRGILCQGRGSAANSAVCFALGITEVDPARMEMLFERFLSRERNEPPDIDVDFEHERREEVIQYVYARYGRDRAALAATVISYRARSAIRDVGKALGLSLDQVDALARNIYWWDHTAIRAAAVPGSRGAAAPGAQGAGPKGLAAARGGGSVPPVDPLADRMRELGLDPQAPVLRRLVALVAELIGFPRHLSQHVGGFVISRGPLDRLVPIENAAMPERTVIQWDKDDLDALGLLKVDCLCLGMLSAIRRAFDLIHGYSGRRLTMAGLPADDPATYAMIQRADTVGVFQIESRAQMAMLPRLKPRCYYDLVIEVALIRPGPIQGEMVHPYLRRRDGLEEVTYPSPEVRGVLERTLGVPLFQEQVIKLAMVAAGFTPGEADQLRRSMATWRKNGGIEKFEAKLVEGMRVRGYEEEFARRIYQQILGFGEYGFPESHAASFALLAYVSAWLKCHEPTAFTAALINSQPMGFYAPAQLVQDARRHGVAVRSVDILASHWDCTLEKTGSESFSTTETGSESFSQVPHAAGAPPALRLGLRMVRGLSQDVAERILAARRVRVFEGVDDLARRAALSRRDLDLLAAADALAALSGHRHRARWDVLGVATRAALRKNHSDPVSVVENDSDPFLLRVPEGAPMLARPTEGQEIVGDYAHVGLTLRRHPLALLRPRLRRTGACTAAAIEGMDDGTPVHAAGLVILRQRPGTATGVVFVTIEDETGQANLIVWSSLVQAQRRELLGARLLGVDGYVQREGRVVHVIAQRLHDYSVLLGRLAIPSRDFH
ncbi:MAG: error-prone DNA polymerase [Gammaproteobacteria bacterium]